MNLYVELHTPLAYRTVGVNTNICEYNMPIKISRRTAAQRAYLLCTCVCVCVYCQQFADKQGESILKTCTDEALAEFRYFTGHLRPKRTIADVSLAAEGKNFRREA